MDNFCPCTQSLFHQYLMNCHDTAPRSPCSGGRTFICTRNYQVKPGWTFEHTVIGQTQTSRLLLFIVAWTRDFNVCQVWIQHSVHQTVSQQFCQVYIGQMREINYFVQCLCWEAKVSDDSSHTQRRSDNPAVTERRQV